MLGSFHFGVAIDFENLIPIQKRSKLGTWTRRSFLASAGLVGGGLALGLSVRADGAPAHVVDVEVEDVGAGGGGDGEGDGQEKGSGDGFHRSAVGRYAEGAG